MQAEGSSKEAVFGRTVRHIRYRGLGKIGTRYVTIPKRLADNLDIQPGHTVIIRIEKLTGADE